MSSPSAVLVQDAARPVGPFHCVPRLWKSDAVRTRIDWIQATMPTRGTITFNEDRLHKRDIQIEVVNPDALEPQIDYLLAELDVTDVTGAKRTYPLGHFLVTGKEVTTDTSTRIGVIEGWEQTYALSDATLPYGATMNAGFDYGSTVRGMLGVFGYPPDMIDVPNAGVIAKEPMHWDIGTDWLTWLNDLLNAGHMYTLWTSGEGRFRSRPQIDIRQAPTAAHYGSSNGAFIVPPVTESPDYKQLRNQILVVHERPDRDPIVGRAQITDPTHPLHPERLQERRRSLFPVWLSESVPDPDMPEGDDPASVIAAAIIAKQKAERILSERASYYLPLTIQTFIDDVIDGHQTVSLDLEHGGTHYYQDRWRQRAWSIELNGSSAVVQRQVYRTEQWK